jgi:hypothetical protein
MSTTDNRDTITVNGIEYDVERSTDHRTGAETLTISLDGEPVFKGIEGTLGYDEFAQEHADPREWANVGTMFCDYRGYSLGDEDAPDPRDQTEECPVCDGTGELAIYNVKTGELVEDFGKSGIFAYRGPDCAWCEGAGEIDIDMADWLRKEHGARVIMPLYVYEHSGITISSGQPIPDKVTREAMRSSGRFMMDGAGWDTSTVGFIFDTPEGVKQCIGEDATDEQIEAALDAEVNVYASYLEGDVTEYIVEDDETGFMESCGGFVGDAKECERQCFENMKCAIERRLAEMAERAEMAARDIITV